MNVPTADAAQHTPLHALHKTLGGRMVEFATHLLPMQYGRGILWEHRHTRESAGLFDVSHMGQFCIQGAGAAAMLESLLPIDVIGLAPGRQRYGFFTNAGGGILDDLMIANLGDFYLLVVNAARRRHDLAYLRDHLRADCALSEWTDRALLALQGPLAAAVLAELAADSGDLSFMQTSSMPLGDIECFVSRSGYTGEDGFEISVPGHAAEALAHRLLQDDRVAPVGLGARDSLRLEAGLCLYGQDIDETTTPVEAGLSWALSAARRPGGARPGGYPGADILNAQLAGGVSRARVGLMPQSRVPVRGGSAVIDAQGRTVGRVTSGGFGPTLGAPVAIGYIESHILEQRIELYAEVRSERIALRVAPLPFVAHRYARGSEKPSTRD